MWPEDFKGQRNFYVHNPAISDPSCAPAGCQSVMIMLPVANLQEVEAAAQREGRPMPDYKVSGVTRAGGDEPRLQMKRRRLRAFVS